MLQLPMTLNETFKIILDIYTEKGQSRVEMIPQPLLDLQGKPNLIIYRAVDQSGQVLTYLAYEGEGSWVEFDSKRHQPENFRKPESKPESKPEPPREIRKRKPIPPVGPDSIRVESDPSPGGGKIVTAKVSNHVEPKQDITDPPLKVKILPLPSKSTPSGPVHDHTSKFRDK